MSEQSAHPGSVAGMYPIRTVAMRTGVNPVTLRAWERRYGLVRPRRTASGHRLYSEADIERIRRIMEMLRAGVAISRVAQALEQEALIQSGQAQASPPETPWRAYSQRMREAIRDFDGRRLERIYNDALALYPVTLVTARLVSPLLHELGEAWASGEASVAEEHFFAVFLRNKLGARFHHMQGQVSGPRIVCACLPGEAHEIGLLLFAISAMSRNWGVVLLGADMPFAPLPQTIRRCEARALVLSGSARTAWPALAGDFRQMLKTLEVPVAVGGGICEVHGEAIREAGAIVLGEEHETALMCLEPILEQVQ